MERTTLCHEFLCGRQVVREASFKALIELLQALLNVILAPLSLCFNLTLLTELPALWNRKKAMQLLQCLHTVAVFSFIAWARPSP